MILSSRQIPKMNLRRASAVNLTSQSGNPMSADMSKSLFQHLTQTPPPSPGLPSLRPRHGKRPAPRQYRQSVRFVAWFCGVALITWFVLSTMVRDQTSNHVTSTTHGGAYEIKEIDTLPNGPAPVVVTDKRGRARWTVSIPPGLNFPLRPNQYTDICSRSMDVAMHVAQLKSHGGSSGYAAHQDYYHVDKNFMDVAEAEEHGVLPGLHGNQATSAQKIWHSVMGSEDHDMSASKDLKVCKSSLTFVLETEDAGFGSTMMGLWMSYGLAKKEGRAFFVDDTNWAYGKYLTYFAPIPKPSCLPPPRTQILPCPHQARHLLVSGATNFYTFGHAFHEEFEDPRAMEVKRQRPIYDLLRTGYEALFHLREDDEAYVTSRKAELYPSDAQPGMKVGIHVRHGDRHPLEFQYQESYIPLDRYTAVAHDLIAATYNFSKHRTSTQDLSAFESQSSLILASDDPDVYTSDEFRATATRAQERIALASKSVLDAAAAESETADPNRPFVDEAIGWEGGFFSALFWTLGATAPTASAKVAEAAARRDVAPSELALKLRELVGRTYLLDLKVLGEGTDGIVCGVSAIGCRLLAVMMGWDRAFVQNRWRNLDGDFDWKGIVWDFY